MNDETDSKYKHDREYWWNRIACSFLNQLGGELIISSEHKLFIGLMPLAHRLNEDANSDKIDQTSFLSITSSDPMMVYWGIYKGLISLEKAQEVIQDSQKDGRFTATITEYTTLEKIVEELNVPK